MRYQFPVINHLDDVRPAIEGRDEFIIAEREWGFAVNYMVAMSDTFPPVGAAWDHAPVDDNLYMDLAEGRRQSLYAAIRRECRGLLFYPDGKLMSRRLHKFFNVNERDETQQQHLDLTQSHVILEKLDGSMITPVYTKDGIRWGTKMGLTDVSKQVDEFVAKNQKYEDFARACLNEDVTPIFEWCSRQQRIVIDYPEDRLVLIAMRENSSGVYLPYRVLKFNSGYFHIPVVETFDGNARNMEHLIEHTRDLQGAEGYVLRFDDGHMIKIKAEEYIRFHKTKDGLSQEKNVVDMLINETIDDTKAFMMDEDRQRIEQFEYDFWAGFNQEVARLSLALNQAIADTTGDRKRFALEIATNMDPISKQVMFSCWDGGRNVRAELISVIKKNVGTQTKIDGVRHLWGGAKWNYHFDGDA